MPPQYKPLSPPSLVPAEFGAYNAECHCGLTVRVYPARTIDWEGERTGLPHVCPGPTRAPIPPADPVQADGTVIPKVSEMGLPPLRYPKPEDIGKVHRIFQQSLGRTRDPRTPEYWQAIRQEALGKAGDIVECFCGRQVKRYPDGQKFNWDRKPGHNQPHVCGEVLPPKPRLTPPPPKAGIVEIDG